MEANLFTGIITPEEEGITLWHRHTKRERWKPVGTAATLRELITFMDQVGSGEFCYHPAGQVPGPSKQL